MTDQADGPRLAGQTRLTPEQYEQLLKPINGTRIAKRSQGGKQLSYLEAWDVKAHMTRIFGFGGFSSQILECQHVATLEVKIGDRQVPGWEVSWYALVQVIVPQLEVIYTEGAVGSASAGMSKGGGGLGDLHDNALKTAASDAFKRCCINLGSQFGLSLYDGGRRSDVVGRTMMPPEGWEPPQPTEEQQKNLDHTLNGGSDEG